jgi:hypothetical protein
MAAIRLYNPNTRVFAAYDPIASNGLLSSEVLLLNILIELQVQTELMEQDQHAVETAEQLRASMVSNI